MIGNAVSVHHQQTHQHFGVICIGGKAEDGRCWYFRYKPPVCEYLSHPTPRMRQMTDSRQSLSRVTTETIVEPSQIRISIPPSMIMAVVQNNVRLPVSPAKAGIHPAKRGTGPRIESGVTGGFARTSQKF